MMQNAAESRFHCCLPCTQYISKELIIGLHEAQCCFFWLSNALLGAIKLRKNKPCVELYLQWIAFSTHPHLPYFELL